MNNDIKAIIFDLDGVLVSTDEFHFQGWAQLAKDENISFSRNDNHRQRGVSRMESLEVVLENTDRCYTPEEKSEMANRKNNYYVNLLEKLNSEDTLPKMRNLLDELKNKGVKLAIGSSSRNALLILEKVELLHYFEVVVSGNDITNSKPDPEVFSLAAERLGVKPEDALVIEDAEAGVEAAHRAGMRVLGVGPAERFPKLLNRVDNTAEISCDKLLSIKE